MKATTIADLADRLSAVTDDLKELESLTKMAGLDPAKIMAFMRKNQKPSYDELKDYLSYLSETELIELFGLTKRIK